MMTEPEKQEIITEFYQHLKSKDYPCIAAHDAASRQTISCYVADHMACPKDDDAVLEFIYSFVDHYRSAEKGFHSVAILFREPQHMTEEQFDVRLWQRLQALADKDALRYLYDSRVNADINSPHFSFSLKQEAFYIIGFHQHSKRRARQYKYPCLVFNPHSQFEKLRDQHHYTKMQHLVRERDKLFSGDVNPMLSDFGEAPEVFQYSGRIYDESWKCPLILKHAGINDHTTS